MAGLTALDIIVLLLVCGGALFGVIRGFVTEVISLFSWIAAIFALKLLHTPATAILRDYVGTPGGAAVLAFALIFAIVFIAGKFIAASLGKRTRQSVLGPVDRVLGLGFGALKGLLAATLLFLAANLGYDTVFGGQSERPDWMRESRSFALLNASGRAIIDFVEMRRKGGLGDGGDAAENLSA